MQDSSFPREDEEYPVFRLTMGGIALVLWTLIAVLQWS